jgi:hypothetical protein
MSQAPNALMVVFGEPSEEFPFTLTAFHSRPVNDAFLTSHPGLNRRIEDTVLKAAGKVNFEMAGDWKKFSTEDIRLNIRSFLERSFEGTEPGVTIHSGEPAIIPREALELAKAAMAAGASVCAYETTEAAVTTSDVQKSATNEDSRSKNTEAGKQTKDSDFSGLRRGFLEFF